MHRYYLTQRGVAPGCQPKGFTSWEEILDGELTNGQRCYGYIDYDRELTQEDVTRYELTPHSAKVRLREYKPFDGWHKFSVETGKGNYYDYAQPGDIVDRETYDYFLNIMPPVTMERGYFQVGEPYSHAEDKAGRWRATFMTFAREGERYYYLGHCFAGEREHIA